MIMNNTTKKDTLLLTSIGRRVELINHLKKTFRVIGVDCNDMNAGRYFVDEFYKILKVNEQGYIDELTQICSEEKVKVVVPLFEGEFDILDRHRKEINRTGAYLLLSCGRILDICKNKEKTYEYFKSTEINMPRVYSDNDINEIISNKDMKKLPLFIKPKDGMGSSNTFKIRNIRELEFFKDYVENPIVQEYIEGQEYTVDVLVDLKGQPIYVIPRLRIEVRDGEVVKSATVHDDKITAECLKVIDYLNNLRDKNGLATCGPLTIQFFKTREGKIYLLEINPRFGGGVPLSFAAGADYGKFIDDFINNKENIYKSDFEEKIMLRYSNGVFSLRK